MDLLGVFIPVAAIIAWFVVSLVLYVKTDKNAPQKHKLYIMLIVSAIIAGVVVGLLLGYIVVVAMVAEFLEELFSEIF